jgi:dTDP-4-amino-4,6-dideoxygalactose transaminase
LQPAYSDLKIGEGSFPITERCAIEVLSLPMFPELTEEEIRYVAQTMCGFFYGKERRTK